MAIDQNFRKRRAAEITKSIGVYALCDLDKTPVYVGQSSDGLRARVNRHLTSARSDIIANRQIDVWEIAYVMAWPVAERAALNALEAQIFHWFNDRNRLMNGTIPQRPAPLLEPVAPSQIVQVMAQAELEEKRAPELRLPRQAQHYQQIVDHFLNVKNSTHISRAMQAHFDRLARYHKHLLGAAMFDEDKDAGAH